MHENNSSPTADQRMPRINVEQIDGRMLDTIVVSSNIQGAKHHSVLDSAQKAIISQRDSADRNEKRAPISPTGRTAKMNAGSTIDQSPAGVSVVDAGKRHENLTSLTQQNAATSSLPNHQQDLTRNGAGASEAQNSSTLQSKQNRYKMNKYQGGSLNERSQAQLPQIAFNPAQGQQQTHRTYAGDKSSEQLAMLATMTGAMGNFKGGNNKKDKQRAVQGANQEYFNITNAGGHFNFHQNQNAVMGGAGSGQKTNPKAITKSNFYNSGFQNTLGMQ